LFFAVFRAIFFLFFYLANISYLIVNNSHNDTNAIVETVEINPKTKSVNIEI